MEVLVFIIALVSRLVRAQQWDTAYSPLYSDAYLKLTNNEILRISNNQTYDYGASISNIISPPTDGNYSITIANGDLYAFYEGVSKTNYSISISVYNSTTLKWSSINYNTTLSKNTNHRYFEDSTIMTSPDGNYESIYIYGGRYNNTISNRILQYSPHTKTLNSIITSISPTGFYGSANAIIDSKGTSNLLIGGKASSGWVSMFQLALWEYKSWTFKTVSTANFSVNSRIYPLVLPVFKGDESDATNVLVLGGQLGNKMSSPYVLNLNLTDDWKWQDLTKKTNIDVSSILGAVVLNSTLFTVNKDSKKRSTDYVLNLFDTDSMQKVDTFDSAFKGTSSVSEGSTKDESSSASSVSSASVASSVSSDSSASSVYEASSSSASSASASSSSSSTSNITTANSSNVKVIVPAVVVPVLSIAIISLLVFFLYKRYFGGDSEEEESIKQENSEPDLFKELNRLDNQSISSWNEKRDEYERRRYSQQRSPQRSPARTNTTNTPTTNTTSPTRKSVEFTFDNSRFGKTIKKFSSLNRVPVISNPTSFSKSHSSPFANPEDYEDKQELSPMSFGNRSRVSLMTSNSESNSSVSDDLHHSIDEEDEQIDKFLGNRDVQVLVSSKRRSKLRITNPDIESMESISEAGSGSTIYDEEKETVNSGDDNNVFADENDDYVRELMKAFDNDDLSTDIGSFDKYDQ